MTYVKICGVTTVGDAQLVLEAGADSVGINLVPGSKRLVDRATARAIADAVRGKLELVAVVAELNQTELLELRRTLDVDWLQLCGDEPAALVASVDRAFKACRIGSPADVQAARAYGGERLLVDARVAGALGGTGVAFDWALVKELANERNLVVAGGLNPGNVGAAIRSVLPWGVDVASGVELPGMPRQKNASRVQRFVEAVRRADA